MPEDCIIVGRKSLINMNGQDFQFKRIVQRTTQQITDANERLVIGQNDPIIENVASGIRTVGFEVVLEPPHADYQHLLPLFLDDNTTDYTSGDDANSFTTHIDYQSAVHEITGCVVNRATFKGQKGSTPCELTLEVVGKVESDDSFSFGTPNNGVGYAFFGGTTCTLRGSARDFDRFALVYDRRLITQFENNQTAQCHVPGPAQCYLATSHPYSATASDELYFAERNDEDGAAAQIKLVRGSDSLTIDIARAKALSKPPNIDLGEIRLSNWMKCYGVKATSTPMLTCTLASV